MKSPIDLIGGFYTVDGLNWACQDTVNYLPVAAEAGGTKTPAQLKSPPGLKPFSIIGEGPEYTIRGMHDAEGQLFVVAGRTLYQLMTTTGVAIPIGTIPGVGRVAISHNQIAGGNQVVVVNGQSGYVYNTRTQDFRRITDAGYPGAFDIDFIDGYMVQVEPFGRYVFHSQLADALDYNTLDRFEAESQPDRIVSILVANDEVRVFGARTTQIFVNTGAAQGTFQSKGITIDRGCAGRFTPCRLDNGVYFLGDDGVVYQDYGYSPVRISTHAIEEAISGNDWSQAFAFTWTSQGHSVYYLTFPDGQTWGYDVASKLWHRRSSYHPVHEVSRRWRLNALVFSNGKWYGGDSTSGRIYTLDWGYMMEGDGDNLVSERVSQVTYNAGNMFQVQEVEVLARTGSVPTKAASFKTQPEGPTITGNAPNGVVSFPWGPYTYSASGGSGNYIFSIRDGSLPDGFTFNSATGEIGPFTPLTAGTSGFSVRVTDTETGLWDEIVDGITISASNESFMAVDASNFYQYKRDGAGFALEQDYTKGTFPASQLSVSKGGRFAIMPSINTPYLEVYKRSDLGIYTMLAAPISPMPSSAVYAGCISSDSNYLFLAVGTSWRFYKRSGDTFELIHTYTAGDRAIEFGAMWSPDGKWLACCENTSSTIKLFRVEDGDVSAPIITSTPGQPAGVAWSRDSARIASALQGTALAIYGVQESGLTRLDGVTVVPSGNPDIVWSLDGNYLYARGTDAPALRVYRWTGTQVIAEPDPVDQPAASSNGSLNLHINGGLLIVSSQAAPGTLVYSVAGATLTKIDPSGVTTNILPRLSFMFSAEHSP